MKTAVKGNNHPTVAIVACLHGDEVLGKEAIDLLKKQYGLNEGIMFIIANEEALQFNKRFIDSDLNRSFPGREDGDKEERIAYSLLKKLQGYDYVIDIHSTVAKTDSFIIFTKDTPSVKRLIDAIPLDKTVLMSPKLAKGNALIDNVKCGISLEFNDKVTGLEVAKIIETAIEEIQAKKQSIKNKSENYIVYDILQKSFPEKEFANFIKSSIGAETFYPILSGAKSYKNISCLKAERI